MKQSHMIRLQNSQLISIDNRLDTIILFLHFFYYLLNFLLQQYLIRKLQHLFLLNYYFKRNLYKSIYLSYNTNHILKNYYLTIILNNNCHPIINKSHNLISFLYSNTLNNNHLRKISSFHNHVDNFKIILLHI